MLASGLGARYRLLMKKLWHRAGYAATGFALATVGLLAMASGALADHESDEPPEEVERGWRYFDYLDSPHAWVSRRVGETSRYIDSYFATDDLYEEVSGSYAELTLDQGLIESEGAEFEVDFRLKAELPAVERRLKLLLETNASERERERSVPGESQSPDGGAGEDSGLYAGLRRGLVETTGFRLQTDSGIKLRTPLDPFAKIRLRRTWRGPQWSLRFKGALFWFGSERLGHNIDIDLDRPITPHLAVRLTTREVWLDETDVMRLGQGISLLHILGWRNVVSYELGMAAGNRPALRAEQYRLGLRFRHRLHEDWLFLEVTPEILWPRQEGFEARAGAFVSLQALFGERYL